MGSWYKVSVFCVFFFNNTEIKVTGLLLWTIKFGKFVSENYAT